LAAVNENRKWQVSAMLTFLIAAALLMSGAARADASNGEYMGYRLGDKFAVPEHAQARPHVAGPLVYEFDINGRDHGVETMRVFVSPESSIIGSIFGEWYFESRRTARQFAERYLSTLRRKYDQWTPGDHYVANDDYQLSVEVQKQSNNGEYWPSTKKYRVAASLIYAPDSLGRGEWMAIVYLESSNLELAASQQEPDATSP
jgi:hypothetical protein